MIRKKLIAYGIKLDKHIIAVCTDAFHNNLLLLKVLGKPFQLCIAKGMNLAVTKGIYYI
jgi:hypothetical protein